MMSPSLPLGIALIATAVTLLLCGAGYILFALGREVGRAGK
jgi:hypothetical protein